MAESGSSFVGSPPSRRTLYRRLIADPSSLPPDFFEKLDHKRKTLDESIHKFVAAKERELKQWIKEQRQLHKHQTQERGEKIEHARRRTSSESTHESTLEPTSPLLAGRMRSGLGAQGLLATTLRRGGAEDDGSAIALDDDEGREALETRAIEANLADRRASTERDKEFLGVFTPSFLPAFAEKDAQQSMSTSLPDVSVDTVDSPAPPPSFAALRLSSDSVLEAESRRPAQLQLVQRSSSSSTERCLTSVLKSPTQPARPNRKRVSLAVGDIIVAPSDSVPMELSGNNLLSHSRRRIGSVDSIVQQPEDQGVEAAEFHPTPQALVSHESSLSPGRTETVHETSIATLDFARPTTMHDKSTSIKENFSMDSQRSQKEEPTTQTSAPRIPKPKAQKLDPDGDLFDLEDEELEDEMDFDFEAETGETEDAVVGRISRTPPNLPDGSKPDQNRAYDNAEPDLSDDMEPEPETPMSFRASSSFQPLSPGFRRPSAMHDPTYPGSTAEYSRAEHRAVTDEVYGSSYARHSSKGSFGPGSMGEEFMARNAERMEMQMRNRGVGQVR